MDVARGIGAGIQSFAMKALEFTGEVFSRFATMVEAAETIAKHYRWGLSTSWSFNLIVTLAQMAERGAPYHEFEGVLMDFYSADGWHEVEQLIEGTCKYQSVSPMRRKVLRDTVRLIRAADRDDFNAAAFATPALFAHLEGILREYATEDLGLVEGRGKSVSVKQIVPSLYDVASTVERPSLEVVVNLLFRSYASKNPPPRQRFSRHLFNHGRALEPGRLSYVIRLLLMIDQVAYLIDKARAVESEAVQFRESWSSILSSASLSAPNWRAAQALAIPPADSPGQPLPPPNNP